MRADSDRGVIYVFPINGIGAEQYTDARFVAHPDGDLTIHTGTVATAAIWARGTWQRVEAKPTR